jgi:hypothetical protein
VLRKIFGSKRDKVTGEWRRLHNEDLYYLQPSPNIIRVIKSRLMRGAGYVARMGERKGAYIVVVGKPEGRRPLGRPRSTWEYTTLSPFRKSENFTNLQSRHRHFIVVM